MKTLYLLLTFFLVGCAKGIISIPTDNNQNTSLKNDYEIFTQYSLPKTELKIQVPVVINTLEEGILRSGDNLDKCLQKILLENFEWKITEAPKEKFSIDKKIIFTPLTIPDPHKKFTLIYKKSRGIGQTMNLVISKDGIIQSGEFAQESKTFEIVTKSAQVAGSLVGAVAGLGVDKDMGFEKQCDITTIKDKRAQRLISDLHSLLQARYALISTPPVNMNNTDVIKLQMADIDEKIKAIKGLLVGEVKKTIHNVTINIDPQVFQNNIGLFSLSPTEGITSIGNQADFDKLSTEIKAAKPESVKDSKILQISLRSLVTPEILDWNNIPENTSARGNDKMSDAQALTKSIKSKEQQPGTSQQQKSNTSSTDGGDKNYLNTFLYYNVPAKYEITLNYGGKPIPIYGSKDQKEGNDDYQVYFPQLGKIAALPVDFKEASIVYYEDIGALKSAKFVKAVEDDVSRIQTGYEVLDSIRNVFKAIKEDNTPDVEEDEVDEESEEQVIRLIIENQNASGEQL